MLRTTLAAALFLAAPGLAHADTIVLAGGCFWGMEGTFEHVRGVTQVVSGYAGGSAGDASYDIVSTEKTGHAEAIRVTYDPRQVSLGDLLAVYFIVAHDPTQLNRQTPDEGPSYRSAIFPQNAHQRAFVEAYVRALNAKPVFGGRIVTRIENGPFFPAEAYHQDFMRRNPRHPYILRWDMPRLARLKAVYPALFRA
ncbi:MAG: peptide-methionine (S)-S-oxide reductase MsrA [Sphingomonadaceae bacterium]